MRERRKELFFIFVSKGKKLTFQFNSHFQVTSEFVQLRSVLSVQLQFFSALEQQANLLALN